LEQTDQMIPVGNIASLVEALRSGTDIVVTPFDTSDPMCCGGPSAVYALKSPFIGDCQWKVDVITSGGAAGTSSQIVVSSRKHTSGVDLTNGSQGFSEFYSFDGLVLVVAGSSTLVVDSEWYDVTNSENAIYILVIAAAASSAYANVIFRQKRG